MDLSITQQSDSTDRQASGFQRPSPGHVGQESQQFSDSRHHQLFGKAKALQKPVVALITKIHRRRGLHSPKDSSCITRVAKNLRPSRGVEEAEISLSPRLDGGKSPCHVMSCSREREARSVTAAYAAQTPRPHRLARRNCNVEGRRGWLVGKTGCIACYRSTRPIIITNEPGIMRRMRESRLFGSIGASALGGERLGE